MSPPRILVLAPVLPDDAGSGLAMRVGVFVEALTALGDVDLVVVPAAEEPARESRLLRRLGIEPRIAPVDGADPAFAQIARIGEPSARLAMFERLGRPSLCSAPAGRLGDWLRTITDGRDYAIVHISRLHLAPLARLWRVPGGPLLSLDLDEDDSAARGSMARLLMRGGHAPAARWERVEALHFARLQREMAPLFDLTTIATAIDAERVARRCGARRPLVVPNSVGVPRDLPAERRHDRPVLLFVGGFGYWPNVDAATWFCRSVWSRIRPHLPVGAELRIIGRNPPRQVRAAARGPGIRLLADVADLAPHYRAASLAVVPVRAGGGSRIKLAEAAANRVPVVATRFGAEGSGLREGIDCLMAGDAQEMAAACLRALAHPEATRRRVASAYSRVRGQSSTHMRRKLVREFAMLRASRPTGKGNGK